MMVLSHLGMEDRSAIYRKALAVRSPFRETKSLPLRGQAMERARELEPREITAHNYAPHHFLALHPLPQFGVVRASTIDRAEKGLNYVTAG